MTLAPSVMVGSVKVIAVGGLDSTVRGRPAEFRHHGITVASRPTAMAALLEVGRDPDSVVLVPTHLEDMPIVEFVDVLRSVAHIPVIAGLVSGSTNQTVSELFDHGVSGTVALPATPARLAEAVLVARAPATPLQPPIEVGNLVLDDARYRVTWLGREVTLTPRTFELLRHMLLAHPRIISLHEIMQLVGGDPREAAVRSRTAVARLRAAFVEAAPSADSPIETVHRVGYRLRP